MRRHATSLPQRIGHSMVPWLAMCALLIGTMAMCVCLGSVNIPLGQVLQALFAPEGTDAATRAIVVSVRLPRVLCAALCGGALALCGGAMQGLLKNPLADGSTLGVSSGASLGAVAAIAFGLQIPGIPFGGTVALSCLSAFLSMALVLALAYRLDHSLSTNTIILMGVIFSMFAGSLTSLIVTFAGDRVKSILFWTMGSLSGSTYENAGLLLLAVAVFGTVLLFHGRELNAFAMGEAEARHIGVNVRRVRLTVLVCVSGLIGVCVAVSGVIGFVGLVIPHMLRLLLGPNHQRLLPASLFGGGVFLLLCDLAARTLLSPRELPIGVITSFIGAIAFVVIFFARRRAR